MLLAVNTSPNVKGIIPPYEHNADNLSLITFVYNETTLPENHWLLLAFHRTAPAQWKYSVTHRYQWQCSHTFPTQNLSQKFERSTTERLHIYIVNQSIVTLFPLFPSTNRPIKTNIPSPTPCVLSLIKQHTQLK